MLYNIMEEKLIKESVAFYFKSATNMLKGNLVMTDKRIFYSGEQEKLKFDHGAIGNIIHDKMEKAMGFDSKGEEFIFDIPLTDVLQHELQRFGLQKRLVLKDKNGNVYKLSITSKQERNEWPDAIENAKKG